MRMPTCLVFALLTMLPRLQAEESIVAANRIAYGSGKLTADSARALSREWESAAHAGAARSGPTPEALAAVGFMVRRVKKVRK